MPVINVKKDGVWQDIASTYKHAHTVSDITDLPQGFADDYNILKEKVGGRSVASQIKDALDTMKPYEYTHPFTHPANMITGLSKIATTGSYKDLKDTPPMPNEVDLLPKQIDLNFYIESFNGTHMYANDFNFASSGETNRLVDSFELKLNETYFVDWDGEKYEVIANDASSVVPEALYLGNGSILGLGDNAMPFIIIYNANTGIQCFNVSDHPMLSGEYVLSSDATGEGITYVKYCFNPGTPEYEALQKIQVGKQYMVKLDDNESCLIDVEDMSTQYTEEGAVVTKAIRLAVNNNFSINILNYTKDDYVVDMVELKKIIVAEDVTNIEHPINICIGIPNSHSVRIYEEIEFSGLPEFTSDDDNKVLTIKDGVPVWADVALDSSASNVIEILPEKEYTLDVDAVGLGFSISFDEEDAEEYIEYKSIRDLTPGEKYIVSFEGVSYECECQDRSKELEDSIGIVLNSSRVLGNIYYYDMSAPESSGEPFCIMFMDGEIPSTGDSNYPVNQVSFSCVSDIAAETINVKIGISKKGNSGVESSLPEFTSDDEGKVLSIKDGALVWSEVSGSNTVTEIDLIGENELVFYPGDALGVPVMGGGYSFYQNASNAIDPFEMTVGESYFVELDGKTYEVQANDASAVSPGTIFLGNGATLGFPDTGEPFAIGYMTGSGVGSGVTVFDLTNPVIFVESVEFAYVGTGIDGLFRYECTLLPGSAGYEALHGIEVGKSYAVTHDTYINRYVAIDSANELDEMASVTKSISFGHPRGIQFNIENYTLNGETIDRVRIVADIADQSSSLTWNVMIGEDIKHTFRLYQEKEATSSSLPEFTSDDENKVLTIKDGTPTWSEVSGSSTVTEVDVLAKATLEFKLSGNSYNTSLPELFELIVDESYVVLWDDTEYNCVAYETEIGNRDAVCLGNKEVMTSGSTEILEPFVISHIPDVSVISLAVANGDESPSHAVRIYQKVESAPQYSWNDLTDKPFEEKQELVDLLPLTEYVNFDMNQFDLYGVQEPLDYEIIVGETYKVYWDGVEYDCVAQDMSSLMEGAVALGNTGVFGMTDTGEDFVIGAMGGEVGFVLYCSLTDTEAGGSHSVRIAQEKATVETLDLRYLPEHLQLGKESTNVVEILPLQTYENFLYDSTYKAYCTSTGNPPTITLGETYIVSWDGKDYKCVAQDASAMMPGAILLGNSTALGVPSDEPFAIGVMPGMGATFISGTDTESGNSHTVGISQEVIVAKTLDHQYLPEALRFGEAPITATLIDGSYDVVANDDSDTILVPKDFIPVISDIHLTEGNTYTVVWDGVEYECISFNLEGLQCVGNLALLEGVGGDTGEPFLIIDDIHGEISDGIPCFMFFALNTFDPSDPSITELTFDVKLIYNGYVVQKLDGKYLPDLFDYLPDPLKIGKISAGTVLVKETTAVCNFAFDEVFVGVSSKPFGFIPGVKYQFVVDGVPYIAECHGSGGSPVLGNIEVEPFAFVDNFLGSGMSAMISRESGEYTYEIAYEDDYIKKIDKEYLPDDIGGGSLPEVTTSDNDKVLTVVDGVWTAQTSASGLPEVTTSDAGKFLRVSSTGSWIVEAVLNAEEANF